MRSIFVRDHHSLGVDGCCSHSASAGALLIARSTLVPLLLDGDRPDIAVAAARQSLNSAVAAGLLRKDPPQCRNLNS
jgi:hypothetical protein